MYVDALLSLYLNREVSLFVDYQSFRTYLGQNVGDECDGVTTSEPAELKELLAQISKGVIIPNGALKWECSSGLPGWSQPTDFKDSLGKT